MNELINGVEVLNIHYCYCPTAFAIITMIASLIILFTIGFLVCDKNEIMGYIFMLCAFVIPIVLLLLIAEGIVSSPNLSRCYKTEYECYLHGDEIDFKEFNEHCEIVSQSGKIYTIKYKE